MQKKPVFNKSIFFTKNGGAEEATMYKFKEEMPEIKKNKLLVKVKATTLNPIDIHVRKNGNMFACHPFVPGREFCGEVVDIGSNIWDYKKGDIIIGALGLDQSGSWSRYILVNEHQITKKPKKLNINQSACIPYSSLTAMNIMKDINSAETGPTSVFIHNSSGTVCSILVQLLKAYGHHVIISTKKRHFERMKKYNVDKIVDIEEIITKDSIVEDTENDIKHFIDAVGDEKTDQLAIDLLSHSSSSNTYFYQLQPHVLYERFNDTEESIYYKNYKSVHFFMFVVEFTKYIKFFLDKYNINYKLVMTQPTDSNLQQTISPVLEFLESDNSPLSIDIHPEIFSFNDSIKIQNLYENKQIKGKIVINFDKN
eukprot:TRINITY_DN6172_c0_g1_i1.p1 TRINITY_DN6172_c0_g1~~TRINITY_DN6172_c0_g1_i1.p1  ORF type:complete len:368 (+),score=82.21 TRINITY_DN6172_c0_g1_i1:53-1156(+)